MGPTPLTGPPDFGPGPLLRDPLLAQQGPMKTTFCLSKKHLETILEANIYVSGVLGVYLTKYKKIKIRGTSSLTFQVSFPKLQAKPTKPSEAKNLSINQY